MALTNISCGPPQPAKKIPEGVLHLRGSGATFPNPLYQRWIETFNKQHPSLALEYASVGSGKGIDDSLQGSVDFGASDRAMSDEQIAKVSQGALLVPTTAGLITLSYNSEGLPDHLHRERDVYVDIFQGKINNWNAPRIAKANKSFKFPNRNISVVVRQDSSGTTFAFTNHLSAISKDWKSGPGVGTSIDWNGKALRAPGNEGVAGMIKKTPGAIGYVEFGLASRLGLAMAALISPTCLGLCRAPFYAVKNSSFPLKFRLDLPMNYGILDFC